MNGDSPFAVDTSFVIAVLKGAVTSPHSLSEIAFPVPVVGELRFGVLGAKDPQRKLADIERLISQATILDIDGETARYYADLRFRLKTAGTPLPENDVWIAALYLQHRLMLIILDRLLSVSKSSKSSLRRFAGASELVERHKCLTIQQELLGSRELRRPCSASSRD